MKNSETTTVQGNPNARYSFRSITVGAPQEKAEGGALQKWKINLWNEDGKILVATLYGIDKLEVLDNAARFVVAINMHDELIQYASVANVLMEVYAKKSTDEKWIGVGKQLLKQAGK